MKKVLFTATVDSHIELFHLPFLKYFKDQGYEVHVATNGDLKIPYCDKKIKIPFARSPFKWTNLIAIKLLKELLNKEEYDLIHTHTPMGGVVTRIAAKKTRKKNNTRVIYTAHGFHFYKGAPFLNWLLFYPMEKYLSKYTDDLILINKEDYHLAKKKFYCHHIHYVPGVGLNKEKLNFTMEKKEKEELRASLGLKKDDFVMIFPAEINHNKNQQWLILTLKDFLAKNENVHLLLPGRDNLNGRISSLVKEIKLEDKVHLLGFRKDIAKLLQISNLALSSSKREGLPVNIMESMYMGLPLVVSNCRGNRDLVEDGKSGYVCSLNDATVFQEKVEFLYKNSKQCEIFSKTNKKKVQPFLLDSILKDMIEIYEGDYDEN